MADLKISQLTGATTPLGGTEEVPLVQSSTTKKVTVANLTAGRAVSAASYAPTGTTVPTNGIYAPATNATGFANAGVETFRTTADNTIQIGSPTGATSKVFVYADNSAGDASQNAGVYIRQDGTNNIQTWAGSGGNTRAFITSGGTLNMDDDNIQFNTAAKGVNFTANTPAAGMTSQLLNWYEEGTFTPVVSGSTSAGTASYGRQAGRYTRVGRLVTFQIDLDWNSGTGTGNLEFTGLPFTSASVINVGVGISYANITLTANNIPQPYISPSTTKIVQYQVPVGGGAVTAVAYVATGAAMLFGSYIV